MLIQFQEKLDEKFTLSKNQLQSKINQISETVEEEKNTQKPVIAFRATCAKNFSNDDKTSKTENPGNEILPLPFFEGLSFIFGGYKNLTTLATNSSKIKLCSVIWKDTEYNIGSAFDERTGVFTCPYDGIYSFYASAALRGQHSGAVSIYFNSSEKIRAFIRNDNDGVMNFKNSSPNGLLKLKKGDTVQIGMEGTLFKASTEYNRTFFQGHLVYLL